jgi:phenylacetate-coenzyme A ligase PaaK-like adenylate-forming protein
MDFFVPHAGQAALYLSLEELAHKTDQELEERNFYQQAARSGLYGPRWQAAGLKPRLLRGRESLRLLPSIDGDDLIAMAASGPSLDSALLTRPRIWVTSRGTPSKIRKWLPLTLDDTAHWFRRAQRVLELLAGDGDAATSTVFLVINEALPRVTNALPYLWERADYLAGPRRFEFIIAATSMLWRNHWDRFALQKQPGWLASSVADARLLGDEMGDSTRRLMEKPRRALFWGEPLDTMEGVTEALTRGVRADLHEMYGLEESFSVYFSAECREIYAECPAHAGLHLWMDGAIHEILPEGTGAPDGSEALFVDQAPAGTEGEYVVTTLGEALPLVRYRTGDRIRVVGTEPCACGITHPRVRFLGRMSTPNSES